MARRASKKSLTPTTHQRRPRQQQREPRQPRQRQSSTCPVCMQRTAAKKLVAVLPVQEDSLRACKDCATELRRDLLMNAYMAAVTPIPDAQECAANIEILLGIRLGALPIRPTCACGGEEKAEEEESGVVDLEDERTFIRDENKLLKDRPNYVGAIQVEPQRLANQPLGDCVGMPIDTTRPKEPIGAPAPNLNTNTDGFPVNEVKCEG